MLRLVCLAWILGIASVGVFQQIGLQNFGLQEVLQPEAEGWIWLIVLFISALLGFYFWKIKAKNHFILGRMLCVMFACISSFAIAHHYVEKQLTERMQQQISKREKIDGIVYIQTLSEGKLNEQRQQAVLLLPSQNKTLNLLLYPRKNYNKNDEMTSMSFGDQAQYLKLGHYYQVSLDLKPPHSLANLGSFDQERWLLQQNIAGTATVLYQTELTPHEIERRGWAKFVAEQQRLLPRWRLNIEKMRLYYRQQILQNGMENQSRALLLGLLTGDRSGINKETTELYQMMGISHLLAISGPHVLILATLMTWLSMVILHGFMRKGYFTYLYRYIPKHYVYLPLFVCCVSFYTAFTGFEIPAVRTWFMVLFCSLALLLKVRISPITLLLLSACMILYWDSFAILSAAFWLSFIASAILMKVYHDIVQYSQRDEHIVFDYADRLKQAIQILWQSQWRISLALIPVVLWQFQAVSLISVFVNLLAIPFLSLLIVPIDIVAGIVSQIIPSFAQLIWSILAILIDCFHFILKLILPIAEKLYWVSHLTPFALACLTIAMVIIMLPKGFIAKYWAGLFFILAYFPQQRAMLNFDVLDVGQGQATVLRTAQHQMLIDTGAGAWQDGQLSMGDRVIVPFLRKNGIKNLDEILLSHLDFDHSGGTEAVIQHMKVKQLRSNDYDGYKTNFAHVPYIQCHQGQQWQWDHVKIQILYPREKQSRKNRNETSCVVLIETEQYGKQPFRILVMGDVGWEGEYYLLQDYPNLTADILVLGHHGSAYSSAYEFLKQVNPQLAIISAGFDNRYGHPAPATLSRLHDLNIAYVNTAEVGAVNIQLKNQQSLWQWSVYRSSRRWLMPSQYHIQLPKSD